MGRWAAAVVAVLVAAVLVPGVAPVGAAGEYPTNLDPGASPVPFTVVSWSLVGPPPDGNPAPMCFGGVYLQFDGDTYNEPGDLEGWGYIWLQRPATDQTGFPDDAPRDPRAIRASARPSLAATDPDQIGALGSFPDFRRDFATHAVGIFNKVYRGSPTDGCAAMDAEVDEYVGVSGEARLWSFAVTPAPTAAFDWEVTDRAANEVTFTNGSSDASGGTAGLSYLWAFGDGETSTERDPVHRYPGRGAYTVTLRVTDGGGRIGTASDRIELAGDTVVNSTGDAPAADAGVRGCDTGASVGDAPECTLRAAIETVVARGGGDITFAIDGGGLPTITAATPLPDISVSATIDGTTQAGGWVAVRAAGARVLELTGGTSTLRGLAVGGANVGVQISGGSGHVLAGDRLGTDPTGTASSASGSGVAIADADGVTVEDSVVGGRLGVVSGPTAGQTTVRSTSIGLDAEGAAVLGDVEAGVFVGGTDAVVEGNRTWGTRGGIFVIGSGATGARVVGNRVGVTAAGAPIEGSGSAIRVDAAPGSTVADNVVWGGGAGAVLVSGSAQYEIVEGDDGQEIVFDAPTSEPHDEGATGGSATIVGNVIGVASPGAEIGSGLIAWAGASDLVVRGNTVRGASGAAVQLVGGARHRLASNVLGEAGAPVAEGVSAIAAADVTVGGAGAGNTVAASTTGVRLEGATGSARIEATTISLGDGGSGIEVTGGAATTVVGNSVTGADQGILAVGEGASVTGNAIDDGGTGITVTGRGSAVQGNVVAGQAEVGIASTGDGSNVSTNSVVRSGLGLRLAGAEVEVEANRVGLSETGAEEGNLGVGIVVAGGAAVLDRNQVAGSTGVGIEVSPAARAELRSNRIWGSSSGRGIQAPGAPAAPQLVAAVRTGSGTTLRRTLVVAGLPAGDAGRIEVFANDSCADPEARYLLDIVRPKASDETFRVVQVRERPTRDHFTVTYTDATGATSELSDCTSGATYPDADGDGSVDPLDGLLDPSGPSDATRAIVATDEEQLLLLGVAPLDPETGEGGGELEAVAITEDPAPNAHPEGWDLPYGALRFRISGLEPGARTNVTMTAIFGSSPIQGTSYWKYAPPAPGEASSWFDFAFDEASGTGAQLSSATEVPGVGIRRAFVLWLADGRRGDVDGGANGTITDPGGPVVFDGTVEPPGSTTTTSTPSSTTSTSTSTLAAAPTSSVPGGGAGAPAVGAGDLARTGAPLAWLLRLAGTALGIGALAWSVGRSRRSEAARAG